MQQYKIIVEPSENSLSADVERHLADGWDLYGFPFVNNSACFCQAMTKSEPKSPETLKG
jgi:hypothetical protein